MYANHVKMLKITYIQPKIHSFQKLFSQKFFENMKIFIQLYINANKISKKL